MTTSAIELFAVGTQTPNAALRAAVEGLAPQYNATVSETGTDVNIDLPIEQLRPFVREAKEQYKLRLDFLRNISGVDFGDDGRALKYHLYSFKLGHCLQITVPLPPYENPHTVVPSIVALHPGANWMEREAMEMFGIDFEGHPNPKNLLIEEDLHIHPLLKAHPLQKVELKQGIEDGPAGYKF